MKSKLLLMTLTLMSTISSKCTYGMDNQNYTTNKNVETIAQEDMVYVARDMLKTFFRSGIVRFTHERDIAKYFNVQTPQKDVNQSIVDYFKENERSFFYMMNPNIKANEIESSIEFASTRRDLLLKYTHISETRWEFLEQNNPTRFAIMLMQFIYEHSALITSEDAYKALLQMHINCGGNVDNEQYLKAYRYDGDPVKALLMLANSITPTPTLDKCIAMLNGTNCIDNINVNQRFYFGMLKWQLYAPKYRIKLLASPVSSNCGYMAIGDTKNNLINGVLDKLNGADGGILTQLVATEILNIAVSMCFYPEGKAYKHIKPFFFGQMSVIGIFDAIERKNQSKIVDLALSFVPKYLEFLRENNIAMLTMRDMNGNLSGVSAAIAHSLGKNLAVVDGFGQIDHQYFANFTDTIFVVYSEGRFQKGSLIK